MPYYKVFRGDMTNVWDGDKNNQLPTVQYKVGEITYATKKINRKTLLPEQSEYTIYFCECALDAANWHANFGHREDVAFCEIKPRGRLGKKDPEWTIFNAYIAGQCFANGIKVIREIPKEDFAKLCMDEYRGLSQKRKDIPVRIHWLRTIGTGLFENMEFEYSLDLSAADDIKENALAGMSAEVLWLVNTRLKMGIKKLSPGMLNGVTVKCVLLLHPEC
ncbi:MAG: hypothetical protein FWC61_04090, partial [Proteobacteria bacterium]|nr:hypothetical protein [Pseudomonadota bacterium]